MKGASLLRLPLLLLRLLRGLRLRRLGLRLLLRLGLRLGLLLLLNGLLLFNVGLSDLGRQLRLKQLLILYRGDRNRNGLVHGLNDDGSLLMLLRLQHGRSTTCDYGTGQRSLLSNDRLTLLLRLLQMRVGCEDGTQRGAGFADGDDLLRHTGIQRRLSGLHRLQLTGFLQTGDGSGAG